MRGLVNVLVWFYTKQWRNKILTLYTGRHLTCVDGWLKTLSSETLPAVCPRLRNEFHHRLNIHLVYTSHISGFQCSSIHRVGIAWLQVKEIIFIRTSVDRFLGLMCLSFVTFVAMDYTKFDNTLKCQYILMLEIVQ